MGKIGEFKIEWRDAWGTYGQGYWINLKSEDDGYIY